MRTITTLLFLAGVLPAQRLDSLQPGLGGRLARDAAGDRIVAQATLGPNGGDIRVRKLAAGVTVFDVTLGGSGHDDLTALLIAPDGDILLLGVTESADFPATPSVLWPDSRAPSSPSSFLVRLDPSGRVRASTYLAAGGLSLRAQALALDPGGSLILGVEVRGPGVLQLGGHVIPGDGTLLVLKVDAALTALAAGVRLGGPSPCQATFAALQVDAGGRVFVAGSTCGDFPVTPGAYLTRRPGDLCFASAFSPPVPCSSGVIARLDASDLRVAAATYLGGSAPAFLRGLALDRDGFLYVTGVAEIFPANAGAANSGFPTTPGAYQERVAVRSSVFQPKSVFASKLSSALDALLYSTFLNGSRSETPSSILVDSRGRALIGGETVSPDFPVTGAYRTPCGPDAGLNLPPAGFVSRLDPDGRALTASATFPGGDSLLGFLEGDRQVVLSAGGSALTLDLDSGDAPAVACVVNGFSFRPESVVAPRQILTFFGANFPAGAAVRFDDLPAELLYASSTQINAIVPAALAGRSQTVVALESGGVFSNERPLTVRNPHPAVKVFVSGDGKLLDRGSPLADVRLTDGSANSPENPARRGDAVSLFTTGVDLLAPLAILLGNDPAELLDALLLPGASGSVQMLQVRIPGGGPGGMRLITIVNGAQRTSGDTAFVWIE